MERALRAVLERFSTDVRPIGPVTALGNAGGSSGIALWRYGSQRGELVARAWPIADGLADRLARVHAWLRELDGMSFVPRPIAARDGRTVVAEAGRFWELQPWLPGAPVTGRPPGPLEAREAFARLAEVHHRLARLATTGPSPNVRQRHQELSTLIRDDFEPIVSAVRSATRDRATDEAARDLALRWVARARALAPAVAGELARHRDTSVALQPTLRDVRGEHVLFEGGRLTGLVDYGAMGIESVASDLARLMSDWIGSDADLRRACLEAYESVRPLRRVEWALLPVFERSAAILGAERWARWHFVEGRAFDNPLAVRQGLERGLHRLERTFAARA